MDGLLLLLLYGSVSHGSLQGYATWVWYMVVMIGQMSNNDPLAFDFFRTLIALICFRYTRRRGINKYSAYVSQKLTSIIIYPRDRERERERLHHD